MNFPSEEQKQNDVESMTFPEAKGEGQKLTPPPALGEAEGKGEDPNLIALHALPDAPKEAIELNEVVAEVSKVPRRQELA